VKTMLNKRIVILALFAIVTFIAMAAWQITRPAKIMAVNGVALFVKNIPSSDAGKIKWWNENKKLFSEKYHLMNNSDNFLIIFMDFGDGYQELSEPGWTSFDKSEDDFICFDNVKNKKRCIYKDWVFDVSGNMSKKVFINIAGKTYIQMPDGKTELAVEK